VGRRDHAGDGLDGSATTDGAHGSGRSGGARCAAPGLQLYLFANGDVGPCCRNSRRYGNVAEASLLDLWRGGVRAELLARFAEGSFGEGCEVCEVEDRIEGRAGSLAATFDHWSSVLEAPAATPWPVRMEFELSNRCNLACVQCNGDLSSTVRARREHRPPMPAAYGDAFFEELRSFLPHLRHASFVGGEPFLSPAHHRVWDLMAELAPGVDCTITTNATVWNDRVERVLDTLQVHPVVSIDGITAATYEQVRVGGDFEQVMDHVERFRRYAEAHDRILNLNFCLMPANVAEFPDLLRFAEARGIYVNAQVVRSPTDHSLAHLPLPALEEVAAGLRDHDAALRDELRMNRRTWIEELERIEAWCADHDGTATAWTIHSPRLLMFPRRGRGPVDPAPEVSTWSATPSTEVHTLRVGPDERTRGATVELADALGIELGELEGRSLAVLQRRVVHFDVVESSEDRYEATLELPDRRGRLVIVPRRDEHGHADEAVAIFALERPV